MGIKEFWNGTRSYFSRKKTESQTNDERGRNAQVGYQQRRTWFDKTLDGIGKTLKYIVFTSVAITGIGAIALGVQYIRGTWPYRDVRENAFIITQNALTEKPARPLKQGVNTFIPPFVRIVKQDGRPQTVTGIIQSAETPDFVYRSLERLKVNLKTQYNFQVNSPEGAAKVYWDYGGIEKAKETLDTIVENALMNELSKVRGEDIASKYLKNIKGEYVTGEDGEKINFLLEAEKKANEILKEERIGIVVTNFSFSNPGYTQTVEAAWEASTRAEAVVIDEQVNAAARIVRANSEAQEAEILAGATANTMLSKYLPIGYQAVDKLNIPQDEKERMALEIALTLHDRDNKQQISSSGGRTINVISGGQDIGIFSRSAQPAQVNYGPVNISKKE